MAEDGQGNEAIWARVRQALSCPVCYEVQRRYYLCRNSHALCEECYDNLVHWRCPIGRCNYDDPPRRARHLEGIIDRLGFEFECENFPCQFRGTISELEEHEEICSNAFHGHEHSD